MHIYIININMHMIINDNSSKTYLQLIHNTYSFLYMFIFMRQVKYENTNHNLYKSYTVT